MDLLISLLITGLIFYLIYLIVMAICSHLGASPKAINIVKVIFLCIALLWLLRVVGIWGGGPFYYYHHGGM
jgi:hypothetical protein